MKKRIISILMVLTLAVSFIVPMSAMAERIKVTLNGQQINFDQSPIIVNGRTLVPVRAIFEAMGCTVLWDDANKIVEAAMNKYHRINGVIHTAGVQKDSYIFNHDTSVTEQVFTTQISAFSPFRAVRMPNSLSARPMVEVSEKLSLHPNV